jgi:translocation and assembly module TamA
MPATPVSPSTSRPRVDLDTHEATVTYRVVAGPKCVFGSVRVDGTRRVDPDVVQAEVTFHPGDPFREEALDKTRKALLEMQLFLTVRVEEDPGTDEVVDVRIDVRETPPRDIRLGLGYDYRGRAAGDRLLASLRSSSAVGDSSA